MDQLDLLLSSWSVLTCTPHGVWLPKQWCFVLFFSPDCDTTDSLNNHPIIYHHSHFFLLLLFCGFADQLGPIVSPPTCFFLHYGRRSLLEFSAIPTESRAVAGWHVFRVKFWVTPGSRARFLFVPASAALFLQFPFFSTHVFAVSVSRSPTSPEETRQNILHGKRCLW